MGHIPRLGINDELTDEFTGIRYVCESDEEFHDFYVKGKHHRSTETNNLVYTNKSNRYYKENRIEWFWKEIYKYYRSVDNDECCQEAMAELLGAAND